jgi:hypothetical protein
MIPLGAPISGRWSHSPEGQLDLRGPIVFRRPVQYFKLRQNRDRFTNELGRNVEMMLDIGRWLMLGTILGK